MDESREAMNYRQTRFAMPFDIDHQDDDQPALNCPEGSSGASSQVRATDDLGRALSLIGQETGAASHIKFWIVLEGKSVPLLPVVYEHAYRIGREALINAFRHSQASRVNLRIRHSSTDLCITVSDNGKGITDDLTCMPCGGLVRMKALAERIGATLKLSSRARVGTEVLLSIPGPVVFDASAARIRWQLARLQAAI
jgi:signal transduction histidine kinase